MYDVLSGELLWTGSHNSGTNELVFSGDGKIASCGWDGIKVWDAETGEQIHFNESIKVNYQIFFSSDNSRIFTAGYETGKISCLNAGDLSVIWEYSSDQWIMAMDLSSDDSRVVFCTSNGDVIILNATDGNLSHQFSINELVRNCKYSPDANFYAVNSTSYFNIYKSADNSLIWSQTDYQNIREHLAFSPDGARVVICRGNGVIEVRSTDNGDLKWEAELGSNAEITCLEVSPDNQKLLSFSRDYILRVWDLQTGTEIWSARFDNYTDACAFSPDNNRVTAGDYEGILKVWIEKTWVSAGGE